MGSPAIYSTAAITVNDATLISNQSEGVCIEGAGSITLTDCDLTANNTATNGNATFKDTIMIYQSQSGDASDGTSVFSMTGGSLTSKSGHVFHVTNTTATINLDGVEINNSDSDNILLSVCDDGWSGADNVVTLNAINQTLTGDILVGDDSTLNLNLSGSSTFTGNISGEISNASGVSVSTEVGTVNVTIDEGSTWILTEDTYVTSLTNNGTITTGSFNLYVNNELYDGGETSDAGVNVTNSNSDILINGSDENDTISNSGKNVTIKSGAGNDSISNTADSVSIDAGEGANSVISFGYYDTISTGADADYISITGEYISVSAGEGNNTVEVYSSFNDTITTGSGNDSISVAKGSDLNISSGAGNDSIIGQLLGLETDDWSFGGNATIDAGAGDDYIAPLYSDHSSINGGEGNDTIINNGKATSINGGAGNDYIELTNAVTNAYETQVIIASEGNDTVTGVSDNVTFKGTFTNTAVDGNNVILTTDNGTLTIIDGKDKTLNINDDKQLVNGEIVDAAENTTIGAAFAEFMLKKTSKGYPALGDTDMLDPDTVGSEAPYNAYLTENWTIESEDGLKLSGVHYAPENPKGQWIVLVTGYGQVGATMNYPASIFFGC